MKLLGYVFSALLILLGLLFLVAAGTTGIAMRWVLGGVLLGAGLIVIYMLRMKVPEQKVTVQQQIDLSGDVSMESLKCRNCGGVLDRNSVNVKAGAVFVHCPYCDSEYQLEEAPLW